MDAYPSSSTLPSTTSTKPEKPSTALTTTHSAEFERRGISPSFAIESGCRTLADNEARRLGFETVLAGDQRSKGLQGIGFFYRALAPVEENGKRQPEIWRLKPDARIIVGDGPAKYLSRLADPPRVFYPHTTTEAHRIQTAIQVLITEGEFKALALADKICPIASRKTCVIGLNGVNGGWHRDSITVQLPDGTKEKRKEGHPHLVDDLDEWEWKKRVVYIIFDSDVGTKKHAEAFKRSGRQGAMGAEHTLAQLLKVRGAEVRIVEIPGGIDGTKYGIDDYIVNYGTHASLKLIYNNWTHERDAEKILYRSGSENIRIEEARDLVANSPAKPPMIIEPFLPEQGLMILAGVAGVGKSMLAMNACHSIAHGEPWLGFYPTKKGRAIYIQTEMPRWTLAERIRHFGEIPDGLLIWTPENMHLNYWEPDGYNKRRETGNRERVMAIIDAIKRHSATFVCFDPFCDLSSLSENDREGMKHLNEVLHAIIAATGASICLVAHNRKIGGRQGSYEGADDILGSNMISAKPMAVISLYGHKRSDETYRYKMIFSKLRVCADIEPAEIIRVKDSLLWTAEPWRDVEQVGIRGDQIIDSLRNRFSGAATAKELMHETEIPKPSFYRQVNLLLKSKTIIRDGNLYYLPGAKKETDSENTSETGLN